MKEINKPKEILFKEIQEGQTFEYENSTYIKCQPTYTSLYGREEKILLNAVKLSDGKLKAFDDFDEVIKTNSYIWYSR